MAIKRIRCIGSQKAVLTELEILQTLGGKAHIPKLIDAHRHESMLSLVLPYIEEVKFRKYYKALDLVTLHLASGIRNYSSIE